LIGGGIDESPFVYKDIHQVMNSQKDLVDILAHFILKLYGWNNIHFLSLYYRFSSSKYFKTFVPNAII
jgi:hypothetical protein